MRSESSRNDRTYETFREDEPRGQARPNKLLEEVLCETLNRSRESGVQLIESLRRWKDTQVDHAMDQEWFIELARHVLSHRLGQTGTQLPGDLYVEVGRALWRNDVSRRRVQRFWQALGAER